MKARMWLIEVNSGKIAADYLGISPMAVSIGMRNNLLPIGFAIHNEERDRTYSESCSYHIIGEVKGGDRWNCSIDYGKNTLKSALIK